MCRQAHQYNSGESVLLKRRHSRQHRIDVLQKIPLNPQDYCDRWVDLPKNERGYYKACVTELARATGLSRRTIEGWGPNFGRCPKLARVTLRYKDMLNQIRGILSNSDENNLEE